MFYKVIVIICLLYICVELHQIVHPAPFNVKASVAYLKSIKVIPQDSIR
jgi:hypothetical protein